MSERYCNLVCLVSFHKLASSTWKTELLETLFNSTLFFNTTEDLYIIVFLSQVCIEEFFVRISGSELGKVF